MSEIVRVNVVVSGRVQGVGYRYFVIEQAEKHQLSGWVTNLANGDVEAEIEGPGGQVDDMIRAMRIGPPAARVDALKRSDVAVAGGRGFRVR